LRHADKYRGWSTRRRRWTLAKIWMMSTFSIIWMVRGPRDEIVLPTGVRSLIRPCNVNLPRRIPRPIDICPYTPYWISILTQRLMSVLVERRRSKASSVSRRTMPNHSTLQLFLDFSWCIPPIPFSHQNQDNESDKVAAEYNVVRLWAGRDSRNAPRWFKQDVRSFDRHVGVAVSFPEFLRIFEVSGKMFLLVYNPNFPRYW